MRGVPPSFKERPVGVKMSVLETLVDGKTVHTEDEHPLQMHIHIFTFLQLCISDLMKQLLYTMSANSRVVLSLVNIH